MKELINIIIENFNYFIHKAFQRIKSDFLNIGAPFLFKSYLEVRENYPQFTKSVLFFIHLKVMTMTSKPWWKFTAII